MISLQPSARAKGATRRTRDRRRSRGIVLAIVLVLIFVLVTAVYAFQRRAIIDTSIAKNRLKSDEAYALARGGLRIGEAVVYLSRLKKQAEAAGASPAGLGSPTVGPDGSLLPLDELWAGLGAFPLELEGGRTLRVSIEDEGARLNLNALVDPNVEVGAERNEEAEEYLEEVLEYIITGIDRRGDEKNYDAGGIARNLLDYMDADDIARNGRDENNYYRSQDPPYRARNGPFLSIDEIGLVEGVDPQLLKAMRNYVTVHPIGDTGGINLNRAEPWVLSIVYSGISRDDRHLIREGTVRDILQLRQNSKILCTNASEDPARCVTPTELGNGALGEGSIYPEPSLPANPAVFRVVAEAQVGNLTRRLEAVYDTRPLEGPQLLSWRRLRGPE
jgi:type II secretory pathway component PulK